MATYDIAYFDADAIDDTPAPAETAKVDGNLFPKGGGLTPIYRMRGFDQNVAVNGIVFWGADFVDYAAEAYTRSVGPVVDIVVHNKIAEF